MQYHRLKMFTYKITVNQLRNASLILSTTILCSAICAFTFYCSEVLAIENNTVVNSKNITMSFAANNQSSVGSQLSASTISGPGSSTWGAGHLNVFIVNSDHSLQNKP